jgi:hypothetical protein
VESANTVVSIALKLCCLALFDFSSHSSSSVLKLPRSRWSLTLVNASSPSVL